MHNCGQRLKKGPPDAERQRCSGLDDSECAHYDRTREILTIARPLANCPLRNPVS